MVEVRGDVVGGRDETGHSDVIGLDGPRVQSFHNAVGMS